MTVSTIHEGATTKHREALHHGDALGGIFRGVGLPNVHDRLGTNEVNDVIGRRWYCLAGSTSAMWSPTVAPIVQPTLEAILPGGGLTARPSRLQPRGVWYGSPDFLTA